ncbi:MAG: SH3 domain-containing protein [bacterium]|nr:SH3 domain-containing protein [bacterium]
MIQRNAARDRNCSHAKLILFGALCLAVACGPGGASSNGTQEIQDGRPGDGSGQAADFATPATKTLPGARPDTQQAYALVDATSLMLRSAPRRDAKALHRLENRERVEVIEEHQPNAAPITIDGAAGRWTKVRAILVKSDQPRLVDGWVFGGYLTKNSDGAYPQGPASGDHTPFFKIHTAERPFDPKGMSFSYGVDCSGKTFSEYGLEMEFSAEEISVYSNNALIHDSESPSGKMCLTIERRTHYGTYTVKDGRIHADYTSRRDELERFAGEDDADDCDQKQSSEKEIQLTGEYDFTYCYERGRTVPGILAPLPGDDADAIPAFWAMMDP